MCVSGKTKINLINDVLDEMVEQMLLVVDLLHCFLSRA